MTDPNANDTATQAETMTAAEAANRVRRIVVETVDGKTRYSIGAKVNQAVGEVLITNNFKAQK